MSEVPSFPLDLARTPYSYIERPNRTILSLLKKHITDRSSEVRVLDVGCGCGANARALREDFPRAHVMGIEPNTRAARLAEKHCSEVFVGGLDAWLASGQSQPFDAVVLSDVLEHIVDPIGFLRSLREAPTTREAVWVISVPNYAVWYNRMRTLLGRFDYAWSGLYDRTHVRFYTRESIRELLGYCGLRVFDDRCTPSLVQSAAPFLRQFFKDDVASGNHLALTEAAPYRVYEKFVEPFEVARLSAVAGAARLSDRVRRQGCGVKGQKG